MNPLVRQDTALCLNKEGEQALASRFQYAEIGKQESFGTRFLATGAVIHFRLAPEQGANIHEDAQDIVFHTPGFVIAGPQPLVPLGKQAASLFWIDIKAEHELTQLLESSPSLSSSALLLLHC